MKWREEGRLRDTERKRGDAMEGGKRGRISESTFRREKREREHRNKETEIKRCV